MNIDFQDTSKFKEKIDIINAKDESGEDIFDNGEKDLLSFHASIKEIDHARQVATLLVKVKEAENKRREDGVLLDYLTAQKNENNKRGSLAYQVVNSRDERVWNAMIHLSSLNETDDFPKTKEKRAEEIKKLTTSMRAKQAELGKVGNKKKATLSDKKLQLEKKAQEEKTLARRENLLVILAGAGEITKDDGSKVNVSALPNVTVKDYGLNENFALEDSKITDEKTGTVPVLVNYARGFLDNIHTIKATVAQEYREIPQLAGLFNDRKYAYRNNVFVTPGGIGHSILKVFEDIGRDKIKDVIKASGSSKKDKLIKYVDDGLLDISWSYKGWTQEKADQERMQWLTNLTTKPYEVVRPNPDWERILELMKEVFPVKSTTDLKLEDKKYLDDDTDPNYLKPKSGSNKGWNDLTFVAYQGRIENSDLGETAGKYSSLVTYVKDKGSTLSPIFKKQIAGENKEKIPETWGFKTVVQLFWYMAAPHLVDVKNSDDNTWVKSTAGNDELITSEASYQKTKAELRYVRIMRSLLKKLGISNEIGDYDNYLLEISKVARSRTWGKATYELEKAIREEDKSVQKEFALMKRVNYDPLPDFTQYKSVLAVIDSSSAVAGIDSEIKRLDALINKYDDELNTIQAEVDEYAQKIDNLKKYDEFEEKDLPGKEKDFDDAYNKKTSQENKWSLVELTTMRKMLETIKGEMKDDTKFDTKYKTKQKEILDLIEKVGNVHGKLAEKWGNVKDIEGSTLKAIQKVNKDKDKTGISLEDIKTEFENLQGLIILNPKEKNDFETIQKAITSPEDYKEDQSSELDKPKLTKIFGFDATDDLLTSWKTITTVGEQKIKENVGKYAKTNKTNFDALVKYLNEKGDGFNGGNKDDYKDVADDTKKDAVWKKFIEKGPKVVFETIVNYEFGNLSADDKKAKREEIKGKDKIDLSKYGGDEVSDDGIKLFMYEEKIGASYSKLSSQDDDDLKTTTPDKQTWGEWLKDWYYAPIWVPILLVVGGVAIFWKSISDWWNGPAEEQGKGQDENDEKDEENE